MDTDQMMRSVYPLPPGARLDGRARPTSVWSVSTPLLLSLALACCVRSHSETARCEGCQLSPVATDVAARDRGSVARGDGFDGGRPLHADSKTSASDGGSTDSASCSTPAVARRRQQLAVLRERLYVDTTCDGVFDNDHDERIAFGTTNDKPLMGDLRGVGHAEFGVYRGGWLYLDSNGIDGWQQDDLTRATGGPAAGWPFVGDFDGDGVDELGVFDPTDCDGGCRLQIDRNHNLSFADERAVRLGQPGDLPVVQRRAKQASHLALYRDGTFWVDTDHSLSWDSADRIVRDFGGKGDLPVAHDVNGDGIDEWGVYRPLTGEFFFDSDGHDGWAPTDTSYPFDVPAGRPVVWTEP